MKKPIVVFLGFSVGVLLGFAVGRSVREKVRSNITTSYKSGVVTVGINVGTAVKQGLYNLIK